MDQLFRVCQEASTAFVGAGERLAHTMTKLEYQLANDRTDIERQEAARGAAT